MNTQEDKRITKREIESLYPVNKKTIDDWTIDTI